MLDFSVSFFWLCTRVYTFGRGFCYPGVFCLMAFPLSLFLSWHGECLLLFSFFLFLFG